MADQGAAADMGVLVQTDLPGPSAGRRVLTAHDPKAAAGAERRAAADCNRQRLRQPATAAGSQHTWVGPIRDKHGLQYGTHVGQNYVGPCLSHIGPTQVGGPGATGNTKSSNQQHQKISCVY